jgi:lipoprotein-anchoring transpeptidase ErfK/SrfK
MIAWDFRGRSACDNHSRVRWVVPWLLVASSAACDEPQANAEPTDAKPAVEEHGEAQVDEPASPTADVDESDAAEPTPSAEEKPAEYGSVALSVPRPKPEELTLHALAGFTIVAVYAKPNLESEHLGYLRMGTRTMVTPKVDDEGEGCKDGFHALPSGGFACASKGLIVDAEKEPFMHRPPPPPRADQPVPYDYAVIARDGAAMWWRVPTSEELALAQLRWDNTIGKVKREDAAQKAAEKAAKEDRPIGDGEAVADAEQPEDVRPTDEDLPRLPGAKLDAETEAARIEAEKKKLAELAVQWNELPLQPDRPFLEKGNMISIGSKVVENGHVFWRTARGGYVEARYTYRYGPKDFQGGEITDEAVAAFGFVWDENSAPAHRMLESGKLKWESKLEHRALVVGVEEATVEDREYLVTKDGLYVRKKQLRMAEKQARPEEVKPWERWIDVDLEKQILVAYEGDRPVYATLVSTGRKGTKEESFRTPKGTFRIRSKHISSSMAGSTATDGDYSIQDVPWAMFFEGNYALHGAFWHSRFGNVRSHGCVNLGPTDARWLFNFATPFLPEGWHGVSAHEGSPGTLVVVR